MEIKCWELKSAAMCAEPKSPKVVDYHPCIPRFSQIMTKVGDYLYHRPTRRVCVVTGFDKDGDPHVKFANGQVDTFWMSDTIKASDKEVQWFIQIAKIAKILSSTVLTGEEALKQEEQDKEKNKRERLKNLAEYEVSELAEALAQKTKPKQ